MNIHLRPVLRATISCALACGQAPSAMPLQGAPEQDPVVSTDEGNSETDQTTPAEASDSDVLADTGADPLSDGFGDSDGVSDAVLGDSATGGESDTGASGLGQMSPDEGDCSLFVVEIPAKDAPAFRQPDLSVADAWRAFDADFDFGAGPITVSFTFDMRCGPDDIVEHTYSEPIGVGGQCGNGALTAPLDVAIAGVAGSMATLQQGVPSPGLPHTAGSTMPLGADRWPSDWGPFPGGALDAWSFSVGVLLDGTGGASLLLFEDGNVDTGLTPTPYQSWLRPVP